jgi:hypothetical protein
MEITDRQAFNGLMFIISSFIIGLLTALSLVLAWANEEQGPNTIRLIGHYCFYIFRFPTHNLVWQRPELIDKLFFPGLLVNVFLYASLTTFVIARIRRGFARQ